MLLDYFSVGVERVAGLDGAFEAQKTVEQLPGFTVLLAPAFPVVDARAAASRQRRCGGRAFPWWLPLAVLIGFLLPNALPKALLGVAFMAVATLVLACPREE